MTTTALRFARVRPGLYAASPYVITRHTGRQSARSRVDTWWTLHYGDERLCTSPTLEGARDAAQMHADGRWTK